MKVFKFGGASVKDAEGVVNLTKIVQSKLESGDVVVVSAMGKTTQNLELMANQVLQTDDLWKTSLKKIQDEHFLVVNQLFKDKDEFHVQQIVKDIFEKMAHDLKYLDQFGKGAFLDKILSYGELLSTRIVAEYLLKADVSVKWKDIREFIRTDDNFGGARVDWVLTKGGIGNGLLETNSIVVTQGYIGSTRTGETTTLGKEGSDFSAAIIALSCQAEDVTFWKDVSGVYSADPKKEKEATLFTELSYRQVVEMTFFGAKVIHPKTMKPLAEGGIPLFVRSFLNPDLPGTKIVSEVDDDQLIPQIIYKYDQVLVSFKIINLEFIGENNIGLIFYTFDRLGIQVNIIQSSATSCTFVIDWNEDHMNSLLEGLSDKFSMYFNKGLTLGTFKNFQENQIANYINGREVFLKQSSRSKIRILFK